MKTRVVCLFISILLSFGVSRAGVGIDTLGDFKRELRQELNTFTNSAFPDSVQVSISARAILWTSADIGGVEQTFMVNTVDGQAMYAVPDTIVEIIESSFISYRMTANFKSWPSQYIEDAGDMTELSDPNEPLDVPFAFSYWADSIQVSPIPIRDDDSIYLKCYVEHPYISAVGDDVCLKDPFIEAALAYACHLAYRYWQEFEVAAQYKQIYDALKEDLRRKYLPRYDRIQVE